ncbi:hypothetical protein GS988_02485 [Rhodococcus hoagii]|nr:hypothetical protein [Prescottella equi]
MVTAAPTQISNAAVFQLDNANVTGTNVSMDHLQNTAGTGIRFVYVKGATQFTLRRGRWDFTSGNSRMTRIVVRAAGATDTVKISDLSMLNKTTAPYDTITSASFVDWSAGSNCLRWSWRLRRRSRMQRSWPRSRTLALRS